METNLSRSQEYLLSDIADIHSNDGESKTGKYVGIVALAGVKFFVFVSHCREWTAAGKYCTALGKEFDEWGENKKKVLKSPIGCLPAY